MSAPRALTTLERGQLASFARALDLDRVLIYDRTTRAARAMTFLTRAAPIAIGYRIFTPGPLRLPVLAHELAHVAQYRRWGWLRYLARGAWNQVVLRTLMRRDVYRWEPEPGRAFEEYGMEQQGQIVQESFEAGSPRQAAALHLSPYRPP